MADTPSYSPASGLPYHPSSAHLGNVFDNVDTSRLNPALPYAQQIPGSADYKTVLPAGFIGPPAPGEVVTPAESVTPAASESAKTALPAGFIGPPAPDEVVTPTKTVLPPGFIGPPAPGEVVAPEKSTTPEPASSAKTTLPAGFIGPPAQGRLSRLPSLRHRLLPHRLKRCYPQDLSGRQRRAKSSHRRSLRLYRERSCLLRCPQRNRMPL